MLPTAVSREARENLLDYLRTTYSLSDPALERALFEFLSGPQGMFRGPYLDIRLPFQETRPGAPLPLEIRPPFDPYQHQLRAFQRLHGQKGHQPQHTLVTTGTGSGKTECFLYPILDHCYRERGKPGIKAILIYPMNALATDQAGRIARTLWDDERLRGKVTAGLFVGGKGSHKVADREHLIDDRAMLRQSPPDILLTNYKMLDFLLLRPDDRRLWEGNRAETLRFLVLDELHTYDGAQGSDVACLIRRLKARLGTPPGGLCCVGTSATIGEADEASKELLTEFAREIFDEWIDTDSVIVEERQSIQQAIGSTPLEEGRFPGLEQMAELDPRNKDQEEWLGRQMEIWLGEGELSQIEVGERLKGHDLLHTLLRILNGRVLPVDEVLEKLAVRHPAFEELSIEHRELVLDSFVALVSHARQAFGDCMRPFLTVQVQLWMREVRDLQRAVAAEPSFRWRSELGGEAARAGEERTRYLPMVRCGECGVVGFASAQGPHGTLVDDMAEKSIGRLWLDRDESARMILLGHGPGAADGQLEVSEYLCPRCLGVSCGQQCTCEGTATPPGLPVRVVAERTGDRLPRFKPYCPECGSEDSLLFLASRAASLMSVSVSHLYQTPLNSDQKLLAFVDSVQDASHRAGFFGARTYRFNLRALVQQMVQESQGRVPLEEAGERLLRHTERRYRAKGGPNRAIPVLVPEDLRGHPDYERFLERSGEGRHEELRSWLVERLGLEVTFEYGFSVRSGRSLEKTGCSTVEVDPEALAKAVRELRLILSEEGLLQSRAAVPGEERLLHFLKGLLNRLRLRGGVHHGMLRAYAGRGGNRFLLSRRSNPLGPIFAPDAVVPRFLVPRPPGSKRTAFDAFEGSAERLNWYRDWASRCLGIAPDDDGMVQLYRTALGRLEEVGILERLDSPIVRDVWGISPRALTIVDGVREVVCPTCREVLRLPAASAGDWAGLPCTRYRCEGTLGEPRPVPETFYTRIFRHGRVAPVFPAEHTGLLERKDREQVEERFKKGDRPDAPNLLVCTPTLEMGIDIGDLSAVLLCSVPPTTSMYLQRIGRAGRSTGNALCLTMATSRPHDLYFHADPPAMMQGQVDPPGCFLDAPEMLKRQVVAFGMDHWARQAEGVKDIPSQTTAVLAEGAKFPHDFIEHFSQHQQALVEDFLARFDATKLSEESQEELRRYVGSGGVQEEITRAFEEVRRERNRLKNLQAVARRRVEELEKDTESGTEQDLTEAKDSHAMLGRLITELGRRYPLNVLTDAGVLPNYAFPEPGVELESVIKIQDSRAKRPRYQAHQYMRPASAAIRELAPFATFYAEGRRVRVDEIDLGTTSVPLIERWRFCASCNHAERAEEDAGAQPTCPGCGDPDWPDTERVRSLVYFRRSRSLATRLEAATADDGDEREREYYQTHDLIDVRPENHGGARLIEELPFGFERLTGLKLREVNFGPDEHNGFVVAGNKVNERGFVVCRDCGRVEPREKGQKIHHTPQCRSSKAKEPRLERVYLYRQVESEAIRLLLPVAELDLAVRQASFKGALELGLRIHFGGRAPHLRVKSMREPVRGGGQRNYLVIFDTVPGGTGTLLDLWREDQLMSVLQNSLRVLEGCECQRRGQDGCYSCLFAYQNQRELPLTSSRRAQELLRSILAVRNGLKDVGTLSDVVLDSRLESELEERFLAALLARVKQAAGGDARKSLQGGEERWELTVQNRRWQLRSQVDLGPSQGVEVPCRPDFLLVPQFGDGSQPSVAIFCDGLAYHVQPEEPVSRLGDDVEKRRAIVSSPRYLVWSITWKDVDEFSAGDGASAPCLLDEGPTKQGAAILQRWGLTNDLERATRSSMELLWTWMRFPDRALWQERLAAIGAAFLVRTTTLPEGAANRIERDLIGSESLIEGAPDPESVTRETPQFAWLASRFAVRLLGRLSMQDIQARQPRLPVWTLRLYDDQAHRQDPQFHDSWRAFLQAVNLLQFVENLHFGSTEELALREQHGADVYPFGRASEQVSVAADAASEPEAEEDPLEGLYLDDETERSVALAVLGATGMLPEPTYELDDGTGRGGGQATLAWPEARTAWLAETSPSDTESFERAGWRVYQADQVEDLIDALRTDQLT